MPYIPLIEREPYNTNIDLLCSSLEDKPAGHLNYVISRLTWKIFAAKSSYTTACFLAGTLILVLFEFVRRLLNPYEDQKLAEEGDLDLS